MPASAAHVGGFLGKQNKSFIRFISKTLVAVVNAAQYLSLSFRRSMNPPAGSACSGIHARQPARLGNCRAPVMPLPLLTQRSAARLGSLFRLPAPAAFCSAV